MKPQKLDQYSGTFNIRGKAMTLKFEILDSKENIVYARTIEKASKAWHAWRPFQLTTQTLSNCELIKKYDPSEYIPSFLKIN